MQYTFVEDLVRRNFGPENQFVSLVTSQSSPGDEADIPGHQGTSPEGGGQSRPWCSSPPCGIIPTPLELDLTTELLGPEADPLDTGDESSDFNESEETSTEPDTSYRPNDSVNSSYGADSSDTSDDSVTSDDGRPHEYVFSIF